MFQETPIDIKLEPVEVFEKDEVRLEAILSKQIPKREVAWTFKDTKLADSLKYSQEFDKDNNKHVLVIRDCTIQDAGEYTINVRMNKKPVNLSVKGVFYSLKSFNKLGYRTIK